MSESLVALPRRRRNESAKMSEHRDIVEVRWRGPRDLPVIYLRGKMGKKLVFRNSSYPWKKDTILRIPAMLRTFQALGLQPIKSTNYHLYYFN